MSAAGHRIRFLPDDREVVVPAGTTLLEAARQAKVYVGAICAGEGVCGKIAANSAQISRAEFSWGSLETAKPDNQKPENLSLPY